MTKTTDQTNRLTGWKDQQSPQVPQEAPEEPNQAPSDAPTEPEKKSGYHVGRYVRKTYTLPQETVDRVSAIADEHGIGKSELARYLLNEILTQVEKGKHKLPLKTKHTLE